MAEGVDASVPSDAGRDGGRDAASDAAVCFPFELGLPGELPDAVAQALSVARAHAICTCQGAVADAPLTTQSAAGPANVGVNAELALNASTRIAGSLEVGGVSGLNLGTDVTLVVDGDLRVGGPLQGGFARVMVAGNAAVAGRIDLLGLSVGGELMQPAGASLSVAEPPSIGGQSSGQVLVPPPCACGDDERVDIGALVREGLASTTPGGCDAGVALQPGQALFVEGDLQQDQALRLQPPGLELSLLVEGNVRVDGELRLGSADPSSTVHFIVGGAGTIDLKGGGELFGVLYAPDAELVLGAPLTVHGALFVSRVAATAPEAELSVLP